MDNEQVILSICIPTYNRAERVFKTVNEILSFYKKNDIEIVVVDDCSTDHTKELLDNIKDKRFKVIHNEERLGQGKNQFYALWNGQGKYVKVLIDRDKILVKRITNYIQKLRKADSVIVFEGCKKTECINAMVKAKGWYSVCTRTHPSSLTYQREALHKACDYEKVVSVIEYSDTPYIYFPSIVNFFLFRDYGTFLSLSTSYTYQCMGNTMSGDYQIGGTDYYKEIGAEKRFKVYCQIGLYECGGGYRQKAMAYLYAGELRNATLWNWESSDIVKKRSGTRTKNYREIIKDNYMFWKSSRTYFRDDLPLQIKFTGITLFNLMRILLWKNKVLEKIWIYLFKI